MLVTNYTNATIGIIPAGHDGTEFKSASITDSESVTLGSLSVTLASPQPGECSRLRLSAASRSRPTMPRPASRVERQRQSVRLPGGLASVQYNNTNGGPGVGSETINVVANDGMSRATRPSARSRSAFRRSLSSTRPVRTTRPVGPIPARWRSRG